MLLGKDPEDIEEGGNITIVVFYFIFMNSYQKILVGNSKLWRIRKLCKIFPKLLISMYLTLICGQDHILIYGMSIDWINMTASSCHWIEVYKVSILGDFKAFEDNLKGSDVIRLWKDYLNVD